MSYCSQANIPRGVFCERRSQKARDILRVARHEANSNIYERGAQILSLISLKNSSETEVTVLSNRFIDNFMPRANGEFVKVYIYLLRAVSAASSSFNL